MTELFDVKDLLTVATADQAEINTKGYFGDNLSTLIEKVKLGRVEILADIIPDVTYCFKSNNELHHSFFLPANKVKSKKPTYRPLATIDELFDFLLPKFELIGDEYGTQAEFDAYRKAEILLRQKIILRRKDDNFIKVMVITDIYFYDKDDNKDIFLNGNLLESLFENYEFKMNNKFVPFGIKEE